jgi:hypothetical protein
MKKVMLIAVMAIFSTVMFGQTKTETAPASHNKKTHKTEAKASATESKSVAQPATAQPTGKKKEEPKQTGKKTETATPSKKQQAPPAK